MRKFILNVLMISSVFISVPSFGSIIDQASVFDQSQMNEERILYQIGQEFVPTISPHLGIEIFLDLSMNPGAPSAPITLTLHEELITNPVLPQATSAVTPNGTGYAWAYFPFPEPILLSPGIVYVMEIASPSALWGLPKGPDVYAFGSVVEEGVLRPESDHGFKTVVVPEPSTPFLILSAFLFLILRRA